MEFKEYLVKNLANIRIYSKGHDISVESSRTEAIDYLKKNGYELSEDNVQIALKKIAEMNSSVESIKNEENQLMSKELDELIDIYNLEICGLINMPITGVNPKELVISDEERVELSLYTFLKIDERSYVDIKDEYKTFVKDGLIGRLFLTDKRLIANIISTAFPLIDTICTSNSGICSYGISGINDELFFVFNSGQKITVRVGQTSVKEYLRIIEKVLG